MKKILITLVLLLVIGGAYYLLSSSNNLSIENSESSNYIVETKDLSLSFKKPSDVDIENWGNPDSDGLDVIFVEKGKGSGLVEGGCGAGSQFIEILDNKAKNGISDYGDSWEYLGKETFGNNIYDVFTFLINPDEENRYYVIFGEPYTIEIAYRPENCTGKDYREALIKVLETIEYQVK